MRVIFVTIVLALFTAVGEAQVPTLVQPDTAPAPLPPPPGTDSYEYARDGRRDPFLNLLAGIADSGISTGEVDGVAGLMTMELSVRGVLLSEGAYVAMVQAPNNRTYTVRNGDKLMDGQIKSVTAEGLIILQDVNDPLALVKQREVYRRLPSIEDAK